MNSDSVVDTPSQHDLHSQHHFVPHPFCPLSANEITSASHLISSLWPVATDLQFKVISLLEPPKASVLAYLEAEHAGTLQNQLPTPPSRKAFVNYYIRNTNRFHEAVVDISSGTVESNVRLGANQHGNGDAEEIIAIEQIVLADPAVKKELEKLNLPEGAVVVSDPWIFGVCRFYYSLLVIFGQHVRRFPQ
jgi:primary-amine oxidase